MLVTVQANKAKEHFVSREDMGKILQACPNAEWRLTVSLCRYAGLRCPSEILELRREDIVWDQNKMLVPRRKTERHAGHETRVIPLFPELIEPLRDVFEQAAEGAVYLITRYRSQNSKLRTQFNRIVQRAGLKPWPKPFQNLRSTRETELMETYPSHVVCACIGNSEAVARKHYLQVTDEHIQRTADVKVAHQVAQKPSEMVRIEKPANKKTREKHDVFRGSDGQFATVRSDLAPPVGLEGRSNVFVWRCVFVASAD